MHRISRDAMEEMVGSAIITLVLVALPFINTAQAHAYTVDQTTIGELFVECSVDAGPSTALGPRWEFSGDLKARQKVALAIYTVSSTVRRPAGKPSAIPASRMRGGVGAEPLTSNYVEVQPARNGASTPVVLGVDKVTANEEFIVVATTAGTGPQVIVRAKANERALTRACP